MNLLDKRNILTDLNTRLKALEDLTQRDFSGGMQSYVSASREIKEIIRKVESGVYDTRIWGD